MGARRSFGLSAIALAVLVSACSSSSSSVPPDAAVRDAGVVEDAGSGDRDAAIEVLDAAPAMDASISLDAGFEDAAALDAGPLDSGEGADSGVARPYGFAVPASYDPATPTPLVILLHGYGASGSLQSAYFGLRPLSDSEGFLYAYPNGTLDSTGNLFWNATDACCNFDPIAVDDVAYLTWIIDDVSSRYNVDPKRVYFVGHSNGGFMAYRMACDLSSRVAAIISLAGAMWLDTSQCQPTDPVAVLQIHGDADDTIAYAGTTDYPSAMTSVSFWAAHDGCAATPEDGEHLDFEPSLAGPETTVQRWPSCPAGAAELWTIHGGGHIPTLNANWAPALWAFLAAHPKP